MASGVAVGLAAYAAFAAADLPRDALWPVVRACVAAERRIGQPFPCLLVDLTEGAARGYVVLRPPWLNDLILSPTRRSVGVEDPFLQTDAAPNYFADAWRARGLIATQDGGRPPRDAIALVVNPAASRAQDQLHIHIGCLQPWARTVFDRAAAQTPVGVWRPLGPLLPGRPFWALKVESPDLAGVEPFRLARDFFGSALGDPGDLMALVAGLPQEDAFLIVASAATLVRAHRPPGAEALLDRSCRTQSPASASHG